jgi:Chaperone of endosialidase
MKKQLMKKKSSTQPVRRSLSEGGFFNPRALIGLFVCFAGVLIALSAFGAQPPRDLADGRPDDGSVSQTGLAPLVTFVDDFLQINDTDNDNITHLFMASEFPTLPNWRMDNTLGSLQFLQFGGVGTATRVTIRDGGNVGIGTTTPGAPLHVFDSTPSPGSHVIIADEGDLLLRRSGATSVSFRFVNSTRNWNFFNNPAGIFQLRDVTGGTAPFVLYPGTPSNQLVLDPNGIGINNPNPAFPIHHSSGARLTAGGVWTNASSRSLKTAFEAIDPLAVLAKVEDLPVQGWRYKVEDASTRHIGPVAEDFQRVFGLGDGESIGTVDANGVALAAIQGLVQKMDQALAAKDAEIAELRQELRSLKDSLTDQ